MPNIVDIQGLRELAEDLGQGAGGLESVAVAGAAELAKIGRWSDRAVFARLIEDRAAWATRMAGDLEARVTGMSNAEAAVQALSRLDGHDHPLDQLSGSPGRRQRIKEALAAIEDLLSTGGIRILGLFSVGDTDVSSEEAMEVGNILIGLIPDEMQSVLWQMGDESMAKWLDALDDREIDGEWQRRLFVHLAKHGGAMQLTRMVLASDGDARQHLVEAIGDTGPDDDQQWVMRRVTEAIAEDDDLPQVAADVFAGMDPGLRETVLIRLHTTGDFQPLLTALLLVDEQLLPSYGRGTTVQYSIHYDAGPLLTFIDATSGIVDPDLKADVFVAAVELLEGPLQLASEPLDIGGLGNVFTTHRFNDESGEAALAALTNLIVSDPARVFDALRLDADFIGNTTAEFFRELLRAPGQRGSMFGEPISHDGAILTSQILVALLGDGIDPAQRGAFFQATELTSGGQADYVNASRLGYFVGTVSRGLDDLGAASDDEWTATGIILGGLELVDPTKITDVISFVESSLTSITSEIQARTVESLQAEYRQFESALFNEILPRDGTYTFDGDAADEFFNTFSRVNNLVDPR